MAKLRRTSRYLHKKLPIIECFVTTVLRNYSLETFLEKERGKLILKKMASILFSNDIVMSSVITNDTKSNCELAFLGQMSRGFGGQFYCSSWKSAQTYYNSNDVTAWMWISDIVTRQGVTLQNRFLVFKICFAALLAYGFQDGLLHLRETLKHRDATENDFLAELFAYFVLGLSRHSENYTYKSPCCKRRYEEFHENVKINPRNNFFEFTCISKTKKKIFLL